MPRTADIHAAFIAAIELNPKGYRYLRTDSFIQKLRGLNWHFTRADANSWIERNQQASLTRRMTVATTVTGSCATWGEFTDGISFTSYGLR